MITFFYHAVVALRQLYSAPTTSSRRVAAVDIRLENIIWICDSVQTGPYRFGIFFVLHLTPSPLAGRGLDIDKKYCDAQLRHEIMFWFSKLSLDNEIAHSMRFVGKYHARHQGVPSKDKIPFEEYH